MKIAVEGFRATVEGTFVKGLDKRERRRVLRFALERPDYHFFETPRAGFEPATCRLGGDRSIQSELPGLGPDYGASKAGAGRDKGRNKLPARVPERLGRPSEICGLKPNPASKSKSGLDDKSALLRPVSQVRIRTQAHRPASRPPRKARTRRPPRSIDPAGSARRPDRRRSCAPVRGRRSPSGTPARPSAPGCA